MNKTETNRKYFGCWTSSASGDSHDHKALEWRAKWVWLVWYTWYTSCFKGSPLYFAPLTHALIVPVCLSNLALYKLRVFITGKIHFYTHTCLKIYNITHILYVYVQILLIWSSLIHNTKMKFIAYSDRWTAISKVYRLLCIHVYVSV